uniref:Uncharacterized protein n=1 Tax=Arundo donax TaxID=35708 RepID=A0A0A9C3S2_ARUDO
MALHAASPPCTAGRRFPSSSPARAGGRRFLRSPAAAATSRPRSVASSAALRTPAGTGCACFLYALC